MVRGFASNHPEPDGEIVTRMLTANPDIVLGTEVQSVDDIAMLIDEVIMSPDPDFRYQTSETVKRQARERLIDPSGNSMMDAWMKK